MASHFSPRIRVLHFQILFHGCPHIISSFSTFAGEKSFYRGTFFTRIFRQCSNGKALEPGRQAHASMITSGFNPTVIAATGLLQIYVKCSRLECAAKVFDRMPHKNFVSWRTMIFGYSVSGRMGMALSCFNSMLERDVFTWTSLITGYLHNKNFFECVRMFVMMGRDCVAYNEATFAVVLKAIAGLEDYVLGTQVHGIVVKLGFESHLVTANAMLSMYAKCKILDESLKLFHAMPVKCGISWSAIIAGSVQNGDLEGGIDLLKKMQRGRVEVSQNVYAAILSSCCSDIDNVGLGKQIHAQVVKQDLHSEMYIVNTLVNMYSKCGNLKDSVLMFQKSSTLNCVTWNTMVSAYAQNGYGNEALQLFQKMQRERVELSNHGYAAILNYCSNVATAGLGMQIHAQVIKQDFHSNAHVINKLIDMYSKCGNMQDSILMFQKSSNRNFLTWNSMVCAYARNGYGNEALRVFRKMQRERIELSKYVYAAILNYCSNVATAGLGMQIHAQVIKQEFHSDAYIINTLIDMYSKCGIMEDSVLVFQKSSNHNCVNWTSMVSAYAHNGYGNEALQLFQKMQRVRVGLTKHVYAAILNYCSNVATVGLGVQIHAQVIKQDFHTDAYIINTLIDMYSKCGNMHDSVLMFQKSSNHNCVNWTSMVSAYAHNGYGNEALQLFRKMQRERVELSKHGYAAILNYCSNAAIVGLGMQIHAQVIKQDFHSDAYIINTLIDMYSKCGNMQDSVLMFQKSSNRSCVNWASMVSAYAHSGFGNEALQLFRKMQRERVELSKHGYAAILNYCSNAANVGLGMQIHAQVIKQDIHSDAYIINTLIDMYSKCGNMQDSVLVFQKSSNRNCVNWTSLVSAYALNGYRNEALQLFQRMQRERVKLSKHGYAAILNYCSNAATVGLGMQIHAQVIKKDFHSDVYIINTLIGMYSKCGNMQDSVLMFKKSSNRNCATWSSVVSAYAHNGYGNEALQVFEKMLLEKVKPDNTTFSAILHACADHGLVAQAFYYFYVMQNNFGLSPELKHYSCLVDALGRSGRIIDALKIIQNMPFKADDVIWISLLSNCKIHMNLQVAEIAAKSLLQLDSQNHMAYVLLSQIYARTSMWDASAKMRSLMRSIGLKKEPGCSWIEVEGEVHMFFAGDKTHPRFSEMLEKGMLLAQMK